MIRNLAPRRLNVVARHLHTSSLSRPSPCIDVTPSTCLVDDRVCIRLQGLQQGQVVTLVTEVEENKIVFQSHAVFKANPNGEVDVTKDRPLAGTYRAVDAMGLFWSLRSYTPKNARLIKKDVTAPMKMKFKLLNGAVDEDNIQCDSPIARAQMDRYFMAPGVTRKPVREGKFRGTIFVPQGKGPFPALMDTYGGLVSLVETRAALLASRGYATFALSYLYVDDLPEHAYDLDPSYVTEATDWFSEQPFVDSSRLGAVGLCFGGFLAMRLAAASKKVRVVVDFNGMPFDGFKWHSEVKQGWPDPNRVYCTEEGTVVRDMHHEDGIRANIVPAWQNGAKILIVSGEDDQQCNPKSHEIFRDSCPEKYRSNIEIIYYPKAGHLIEPPYTPLCRVIASSRKRMESLGFIPEQYLGEPMVAGGFPEEHAFAQEASWHKALEFLKQNL